VAIVNIFLIFIKKFLLEKTKKYLLHKKRWYNKSVRGNEK